MYPSNDSKAEDRSRIIVGEADPLARQAIALRFERESTFTVVASSGNPREIVELSNHYRPELALLDSGAEFNGLDVCRRIVESDHNVRILMLQGAPDCDHEVAALWAGASGVIPKARGVDAIVMGCLQVMSGRMPHSDASMRLLLERMRSLPESGAGMRPVRSELTSREWEVLDLLTQGSTTESIAAELVLSPDTVLTHIKNILRKLDVSSRAAAIERARQLRWPEAVESNGSGRESLDANGGSDVELSPKDPDVPIP